MSIANCARRGLAFLLPALALLVMAASNPQCARTQDHLFAPTSYTASDADVGVCFSACAKNAAEARAEELSRFRADMAACGENNPECRQAAAAAHVQNLHAINTMARECMNGCHSQGQGTGGN